MRVVSHLHFDLGDGSATPWLAIGVGSSNILAKMGVAGHHHGQTEYIYIYIEREREREVFFYYFSHPMWH
jgi:hypothetical protein